MFNFFKKFKKDKKLNRGMTYVELIVVLSIFAVMSSIVLFNYGKFQAKVDIKNLANDIALKIVQAQKDAMSGKLPTDGSTFLVSPSYGVYFDLTTPKSFIYFTNLDSGNFYDFSDAWDTITITKNSIISGLEVVGCPSINNLSIVFRRPDSSALINNSTGTFSCSSIEYAQVTISSSDNSAKECIRIYPSGRIQISECPV